VTDVNIQGVDDSCRTTIRHINSARPSFWRVQMKNMSPLLKCSALYRVTTIVTCCRWPYPFRSCRREVLWPYPFRSCCRTTRWMTAALARSFDYFFCWSRPSGKKVQILSRELIEPPWQVLIAEVKKGLVQSLTRKTMFYQSDSKLWNRTWRL